MFRIDRDLNFGREHVGRFVARAKNVRVVVDLGAGSGADLEAARAAHPAAEQHAVELYEPYQELLRKRGVVVHPLDIEQDELPFEDGSVDVVVMNQILEHVKEVFWIFHEVTRVLRVGGSLVLGVPNLAAFHNRLLLLAGRQPTPLKNNSAHVRGWSRDDLHRFFRECFDGYEPREFAGSNFYPFSPFLARPLARLFPNLAWGIFLRWEKTRPYDREFLDFPRREGKVLQTNFRTAPRSR